MVEVFLFYVYVTIATKKIFFADVITWLNPPSPLCQKMSAFCEPPLPPKVLTSFVKAPLSYIETSETNIS